MSMDRLPVRRPLLHIIPLSFSLVCCLYTVCEIKAKKSLSFCLSVNKTWNWLHSQSPHESQPLILSHSIWEEAQKWLVWITFQMQYSCFKLNYCLSDVEHMVSLQFWSGILGNSPYIVITCKCLGTWWKGQQQWTHNGKAWAGTQSHSE